MGFSRYQAEEAIKKYSTVQGALDSLLAGVGRWKYQVHLSYCGIIIVCGDSFHGYVDTSHPQTLHPLCIMKVNVYTSYCDKIFVGTPDS